MTFKEYLQDCLSEGMVKTKKDLKKMGYQVIEVPEYMKNNAQVGMEMWDVWDYYDKKLGRVSSEEAGWKMCQDHYKKYKGESLRETTNLTEAKFTRFRTSKGEAGFTHRSGFGSNSVEFQYLQEFNGYSIKLFGWMGKPQPNPGKRPFMYDRIEVGGYKGDKNVYQEIIVNMGSVINNNYKLKVQTFDNKEKIGKSLYNKILKYLENEVFPEAKKVFLNKIKDVK